MIRVSVFYTGGAGNTFDMDYFLSHHIPLVHQTIGAALKAATVEQGLSGGMPGTPPLYAAICHFDFDSMETFQASFGPSAGAIMSDVPNYTNVQPILQISQITHKE